jgi:hypothetical protein
MNTIYNPITGQWERLDDVLRPFPVIARDTRLIATNNTAPFVPAQGALNIPNHTDIFGNTDSSRANIGITVENTSADVVVPDVWRIRRFIILCNRSGSGTTNVNIHCVLWGRLLAPDGTPTIWRQVAVSTDAGSNSTPIRFLVPSSLAGALGYDQYRITFRREPNSDPAPELSLIRVYVEF